jgi:radical SAM superfamily enzyme YgiQ (UPF0313 family)
MDELIIIDDGFNLNIKRAEEICDQLINRDYRIHLRFTNGLRADKLPPRLAWKLKKAGTYDIVLGIESGNQEVVNKIGKNLNLDKVRQSVRLLKKLDIHASGFFMVGLPYEDIHAMIDTKNFIKELDLDVALISRTIPFPETKLYDIVEKNGRFLDTFEQEAIFYSHKNAAYEMDHLPRELIELAFQDYYRTMYVNIKKIFKYIGNIRLKNWRVHLNFAITTILNLIKRDGTKPGELKKKIMQKLRTKSTLENK